RRAPSLAEAVRGLDVDRLEALVDAEHDRQADRRLGGGEHDDEDREDLSVVPPAAVTGEGHVVHVGGVQDELDAHQDPDRVPARHDGEQAEGEEDARERDEMAEGQIGHAYALTSLRDTTTAPMSAASSTIEAISKGST